MSEKQTFEISYAWKEGATQTLKVTTRRKTAIKIEVDGQILFEKFHIKWRYRLPFIGRWLEKRQHRLRFGGYAFDGRIDSITLTPGFKADDDVTIWERGKTFQESADEATTG